MTTGTMHFRWILLAIAAGCGTSPTSSLPSADAPPGVTDAATANIDAAPAVTDAATAVTDATPADLDAGTVLADAGPLPVFPVIKTAGRSTARLEVTAADVIVLDETLTGFNQEAPGPRTVRAIDRRTFAERSWAPAAPARLADAAVHPSGAVTLAVVDEHHAISIVRLDAGLTPVLTTPLEDPDAATDPIADPQAPPGLHASFFTADSVRVAALGEDVVVAVLTSRNSLIAYRLRVVDDRFVTTWRSLIEPALGLTPFLPIGGSFDTFGAIVAWFHPSLATDGQGNAYLAVWAGQRRIPAHDAVFADALVPLPTDPNEHDSDVLVTKIDGDGKRLWTRVVGTKFEDEPYALAAAADEVVVVGRSRKNPGTDNSQWDPWIAALDGRGDLIASRTLPFDASGILLGVAVDASGQIVAGGSDGWTQNPDGLSILSFGAKLVFTLADAAAEPVRLGLPDGPRHNEIRSVVLAPEGVWAAGHEDGPLTHSGDGDASQIHATGVITFLPR